MTAWTIRQFVLACDHHDPPGVQVLVKPEGIRCTERFAGDIGVQRSKVRWRARRRGWVHVHESGAARQADKDYCPKHAADAGKS